MAAHLRKSLGRVFLKGLFQKLFDQRRKVLVDFDFGVPDVINN